ncbi:hypothetical protein R6Z07M_014253 [Ovis aries]
MRQIQACSAFSLGPVGSTVTGGESATLGTPAPSRSPRAPRIEPSGGRKPGCAQRPAVGGDRPPAAARPVGRPRPGEPALAPGESGRLAETRVAELGPSRPRLRIEYCLRSVDAPSTCRPTELPVPACSPCGPDTYLTLKASVWDLTKPVSGRVPLSRLVADRRCPLLQFLFISWEVAGIVIMVGFKATDVPPTATVKFLGAGTAACIADLITFPLDTAKVRLQIQGERQGPVQAAASAQYRGVLGTILTMVRTEGPRSLYSGLVAGLQRQMSFASVRIGLYDSVKQFYTKGSEHAGIGSRLLAGSTTGALAVAVAQPTDVVKVRFQAQARAGAARRYQSTVEAYKTIAREEGFQGLWKGTSPNVARNAIVNCAELVTYDLIKDTLLKAHLMTDDLPCHFTSAFGAGFCTTVIASPVDVVKTRYMNSALGQYSSAGHCALTMLQKEGPQAFYKGFMPSFLRLGSWNVVMFVTYEQLKRALMAARASREAPF